jgi:hypothetical protein
VGVRSSSRSLCVGVSFGDIVALDSFDDDADKDGGTAAASADGGGKHGAAPEGYASYHPHHDHRHHAPPPRRMRTLPPAPAKLAPAPALQLVVRPDLGGEACLLPRHQEEELVRSMWDRLSDDERRKLSDPSMLARHLRAEKGHADRALQKCRGAVRWRSEFGVDAMHEWGEMLRVENATGKIYVRGYDAEGRAYLYMRPARQNTHNERDNMRHLVWNLEKAVACTRRKSAELMQQRQQQQQQIQDGGGDDDGTRRRLPLEKINLIIDYHGFTLRNAPSMSASKYTLDILQKYYPERMHRAYCVNAPRVFQTFYAFIRAFIDPATKEKIVFVDGGCEKLVAATERPDKLEAVVGGPPTSREFDSTEYLSLPFDRSFDEDA